MRDVTEVFHHYRLTARELWNQAIWSDPDLRWVQNVPGKFEKIRELLFEVLVLEKLAVVDKSLAENEPWEDRFRVVPSVPQVEKPGCVANLTPILRRAGGGITGKSSILVLDSDVILSFLDFFNWGNMDYLDFSIIRVRVLQHLSCPELIGSEALIDANSAHIFLTDVDENSPASSADLPGAPST